LSAAVKSPQRRRTAAPRRKKPSNPASPAALLAGLPSAIFGAALLALLLWWFTNHYTVSLQSPLRIHLQWPVVIAERLTTENAAEARGDQHGHRLTAWQQYACGKFGADCRVALAIQRAENPQGKCEIYHYNTDGTLDWGYFQINTVHLKRPGLNLRDLLDCRANIDFAYQLYQERHGFTPWSTFNSGKYRQFLESR